MILRPVAPRDIDALERLAALAGRGMTNLPTGRAALEQKIVDSTVSFARAIGPEDDPGEESYLFVLEDAHSGEIGGCCGVIARVGLSRPFYSFRIVNLPHTSEELRQYLTHRALLVVNEYTGVAEVGQLFLAPEHRGGGNGRFLSRVRFLFFAEFRERFPEPVIAEMRGVQDADGKSVFWESLGRHFFDMDFSKADYLSALGRHQFIADLMPKHPIYTALLPETARAVIGVAHEASRPALRMLEREGFRFEGCVDVFDAGPTVRCPIDDIATVRSSRRAEVEEIVADEDLPRHMLATTDLAHWRACVGGLRRTQEGVAIEQGAAAALGIGAGDAVRCAAF